jgi:NADPH-dependent 2,4-dienoyl-CoA reductase/sulfur reductase-like enzyme/nitrite reductase/ring-hydroxylating ferredoxin subunit
MSDQKAELEGPDFGAGVSPGSLKEGEPNLGHFNGEAVVVVRSGDAIHAVGATCTHYSGPLADGLVDGDTIHCPWHHACFDLKSGAAIGGPALNDLPCYDVERSNTSVKISAKRGTAPTSIVVLGAGPAGAAAVEALKRHGYAGKVTLIGDEGPVDRPNLSKDYLAGTAPEEWMPLRDAAFYAEKKIDYVADLVSAIDPGAKSLTLKSGRKIEYGALLIATGAAPIQLQIPGADRAHMLRTLADSKAIIALAAKGKRAVVIGASFIGLEVAASLRKREVSVDVVAPEEVPLARILGPEAGTFIRKLHEENGVRFHLQKKPKAIYADAVELESGERLPCDFVVTGVGVRPRVELAQAAGLKLDNGIVVDGRLRTSDPSIYAAGDVARYPNLYSGETSRVEHFAAAERQGQHAAAAMLGKASEFRDPPFFWSQHYDVQFSYVGRAMKWDRIEIKGSLEKRDAALAYISGNKVLAVVTVNRDAVSLRAEAAMQRGDSEAVLEALQ